MGHLENMTYRSEMAKQRTITGKLGKMYPLSFRVAVMETDSGYTLTDGRRFAGEYVSIDEAIEDTVTRRKLFFGEEL